VDSSASFLFLQSRGCMCSGLRAPSVPNGTPKGVPVSSPSIVLGACRLRLRPETTAALLAVAHGGRAGEVARCDGRTPCRETRRWGEGGERGTASSGYMLATQAAMGPGRLCGLLCFWRCSAWLFLRLHGLDRTRRILTFGSPQRAAAPSAQGPRCQPRRSQSVKTPAAHVD
jgi:hypothetical protein